MNVSVEWGLGRVDRSKPPAHWDSSELHNSSVTVLGGQEYDGDTPTPQALAEARRQAWLYVRDELRSVPLLKIYELVRQSGLPNMLAVCHIVPSQLRHSAWNQIATGHSQDSYVLGGIMYGFPLHYIGQALSRENRTSHSSADKYQAQVVKYVECETQNHAMLGPFDASPFRQWTNFSPIMTRPKAEAHKRRIIVDLSFPEGDNVNAFVQKNIVFGRPYDHRLPTVNDTVEALEKKGFRALLATIDIERAYRNVPVCPLDLPLLGIKVADKVYIDAAMPFGARNSSLNMQMIAQFIVRALQIRGISCQMYLDDMIIQLSPEEDYHTRFQEVMALYRFLGLPISYAKIQPPAEQVVYLGINMHIPTRALSIPPKKLKETIELTQWALTQKAISKKMTQRIIGKLNHVAKCVDSVRLFMARILLALREAKDDTVLVDSMKPDLHWFALFARRYNGRSMMKDCTPSKVIKADSCLTGGGRTDMDRFYEIVYTKAVADAHHISTLEAINCMVALRTLLTSQDRHSTVELQCDSASAIAAFAFGRARDPVLLAVCPAVWYLAAYMDVKIIYTHIPGEQMDIPDSLSRAHLSTQHRARADEVIQKHDLVRLHVKKYATNYSNYI